MTAVTKVPQDAGLEKLANLPDSPRSILVAEDEHLLARTLCSELEQLGYNVAGVAPNGKVAIELAEQTQPDLALIDIRMPEMDGLEAGKILFGQMNIPLVVVTAYGDPSYVNESASLGVFGYLLKPVNADDLRVTISVAWRRYVDSLTLAGQVRDLELKLENRKLIERAKGLIMDRMGIREEQAMRRLQKQARDARRPMVELARAIIDAKDIFDDSPEPQ